MRTAFLAVALGCAVSVAISAVPAESKGKSSGATTSNGNVTYRAAPEATLKYGDGVTVHRHADGSVEVSDPESAPQALYPTQRPVRRAIKYRAAVRKATAAKTKAKRK